ncbi:MAG: hypothetical protein GC190_03050 [Alphaproteobacteria bacterium]|nr:hypothetical protein [Alphaproteobacteria bacterium]
MELVTQTFQETFTWQWVLLALPIAFIVSLLVNRVVAAGIFAFVAVAVQHLWPVVWPLFQQNAARDAMMTAATDTLQKINPLAAGMEWIAFTFFIVVFSLTRQDMFRRKPDH